VVQAAYNIESLTVYDTNQQKGLLRLSVASSKSVKGCRHETAKIHAFGCGAKQVVHNQRVLKGNP
jgi:acetolactate synthase small subunit